MLIQYGAVPWLSYVLNVPAVTAILMCLSILWDGQKLCSNDADKVDGSLNVLREDL